MGQMFSGSREEPASDQIGASQGQALNGTQGKADLDHEWAQVRRDEALSIGERLLDEVKRLNELLEAERTARGQLGADEATLNTVQGEEVATLAREAEEERRCSQMIWEDAERTMTDASEEVERAQKAAHECRSEAEEAARAEAQEDAERTQRAADEQRREVEEAALAAAEEAQKAKSAKEEAESNMKETIQPVVMPSPEELASVKKRIQYRDNCFHFVVAGESGSGKSSLVNAFRGLRVGDAGAAPVSVAETTHQITRYPDTNPESPFVWYITGASTSKRRDWQYFKEQGLYVFDCIILLFNNRFSMTDLAILVNARRFNIPTFIVRSEAERRIKRIMSNMGYNSDEDTEASERRTKMYDAARNRLVEGTRKWVRHYLEAVNLPNQRVYIVSSGALTTIVQSRTPKKTIDEVELLNDLFNQPYTKRVASARSDELMSTRTVSWSRG